MYHWIMRCLVATQNIITIGGFLKGFKFSCFFRLLIFHQVLEPNQLRSQGVEGGSPAQQGHRGPGGPRPPPPRPIGLRRREGPEELTCLPPPPPLLCGGAAEVLAKVAAPKPPPLLLPPVPLAAPEPAPPPPAPPRPVQWWQRISPCGPFFHMEDDVVLQTLQVGFRPRGIVADSGGPRGRSDTGMATDGPGRPLVGPSRPATIRAARAPSYPR